MKERIVEIPRSLIIAFFALIILISAVVVIFLVFDGLNKPTVPETTVSAGTGTRPPQVSTIEAGEDISLLAAAIAKGIVDGTAYKEPDQFPATEAFSAFLDRIAGNIKKSGQELSSRFVRYEGDPVITISTDEFADISVHVIYQDSAMNPDALYLAEIEAHLLYDDGWKIDSINVEQKGIYKP